MGKGADLDVVSNSAPLGFPALFSDRVEQPTISRI